MRSTFYLRWHIKFASPFLPKGRSTALVNFCMQVAKWAELCSFNFVSVSLEPRKIFSSCSSRTQATLTCTLCFFFVFATYCTVTGSDFFYTANKCKRLKAIISRRGIQSQAEITCQLHANAFTDDKLHHTSFVGGIYTACFNGCYNNYYFSYAHKRGVWATGVINR